MNFVAKFLSFFGQNILILCWQDFITKYSFFFGKIERKYLVKDFHEFYWVNILFFSAKFYNKIFFLCWTKYFDSFLDKIFWFFFGQNILILFWTKYFLSFLDKIERKYLVKDFHEFYCPNILFFFAEIWKRIL